MKKGGKVAALLVLGISTCFAETWTGTLVDAGCVNRQSEKNTPPASSRGMAQECPAMSSTTEFGVETPKGRIFRFDNAGNAKAEEEARSATGAVKMPAIVTVTGTLEGKVIRVQSIQIHQQE